jgi:hypothetical protein
MRGFQLHGGNWRRSLRRLCRNSLVLLCAAGCASRGTIAVSGDARLCAESESRLVADAEMLEDGRCSLRVAHEREREMEREFWKIPASGRANPPAWESARVAEGANVWQPSSTGEGGLIVAVLYYGIYLMYAIYQTGVRIVEGISDGVRGDSRIEDPPAPDRACVRYRETFRSNSYRVMVSREDGTHAFNLGVQPEAGYILGAALVERLGGSGARVLVWDGELRGTVTFGAPR